MSTSDKICNDGASSKSNNDGVCEVNDMLQHMTTADKEDEIATNMCANCGKEGSDVNNTCNKCNSVMYCNAACKKKHRHKHKKDCDEHLRHVAELHDEILFKQPPSPYGDCPICFLRMPTLNTGFAYYACCGKVICSGCFYANAHIDLDKQLCAFCRIPSPEPGEEAFERIKKRAENGDAEAIGHLGQFYANGTNGLPQNYKKALELYHRAAELGSAAAYYNIGRIYNKGDGVEVDISKAMYYYELAAVRGDADARYSLGYIEATRKGNVGRALQHWMIAVRGGDSDSLDCIKKMYSNQYATKGDYTKALVAYQGYLVEVKSAQRDEAAAADEYPAVASFKYIH